MIYKFLRWFASIGIKFYYKNVFIAPKLDALNENPTIIASNHPSGFYESLILSTISKRPPIFLVRADYISIKGLKWIFDILRLYPIYRQSEGLKDVNKNNAAFAILHKELKKKTPVCIYPEGTTRFNFRIKPIKKGIARLAIGAINSNVKNLEIVPIGFNFEAPVEFRSNLFINTNSSLQVEKAINNDEELPVQLRSLTKVIEEKMRTVTIDLNSKEQFNIYKILMKIFTNDYIKTKAVKAYTFNSDLPSISKDISNKLSALNDDNYNSLKDKVNEYTKLLSEIKSSDYAVSSSSNTFFEKIKFYLGYPIYILGIILNALPILFALNIRKSKIKQYEYRAVVTVLIGQFAYLFYFLFILLLSIIFFPYSGLIVLALPFLLWYALRFYDFKMDYKAKANLDKSKKRKILIEQRNQIKHFFS